MRGVGCSWLMWLVSLILFCCLLILIFNSIIFGLVVNSNFRVCLVLLARFVSLYFSF